MLLGIKSIEYAHSLFCIFFFWRMHYTAVMNLERYTLSDYWHQAMHWLPHSFRSFTFKIHVCMHPSKQCVSMLFCSLLFYSFGCAFAFILPISMEITKHCDEVVWFQELLLSKMYRFRSPWHQYYLQDEEC